MTLVKLSLRNARRQAGDYLVYFVTVILSAALIYAFNGLVFSEELKSLSSFMESLPTFIVFTSALVVFIMGWLIQYITTFMLSRRSREFGTYILIGLENSQVGRMFFLENLMAGGVALLFGLPLGNLSFQVLRAVTLSLFRAPYTFSLTFSPKAMALTFVYFGAMYLLALHRSRRRIRTLNIRALIYFEKQNEEELMKKSRNRRKLFTLSILSGITGTLLLLTGSMLPCLMGTGCVIFFLYGFFLSFSSGVPAYFQKRPGKKYASHTLLIFRTLSAKLTTMGMTMATISLLFTVTLVSEGTGMLFGTLFESRVEGTTCFDIFIGSEAENAGTEQYDTSVINKESASYDRDSPEDAKQERPDGGQTAGAISHQALPGEGPSAEAISHQALTGDSTTAVVAAADFGPYLEYIQKEIPIRASMQYNIYCGETLQVTDYIAENAEYYAYYAYDTLMAYSDYAALRDMLGYEPVSLASDEYLIHCMAYLEELLKDYGQSVTVGGAVLSPKEVRSEYFTQIWDGNGRGFILVVPDACLSSRPVSHSVYGAMTLEPLTREQDDRLSEIHEKQQGGASGLNYFTPGRCTLMTKTSLEREYAAMSACTIFPLYYLSIVLTMASATILTVQQLSESTRYRQQFTLLRKLGMDRTEMAQVLGKQFAIYYACPALPSLLIAIPFLWNMGHAFEPGVIKGPGHLAGILGVAIALFFLIYFVYILMSITTLRRNVLAE